MIIRLLMQHAALKANLGSIGVIRFFYGEGFKRSDVCFDDLSYKRLIRMCVRKFSEIIPGLNGEARNVDLFREQMGGRLKLINKLYPD